MMLPRWTVLKQMVFVGCGVYCTKEYVVDYTTCHGNSMEPTLSPGDILLIERISVRMGNIKKGDIVLSKYVTDPNRRVCKRVTGITGDQVSSHTGAVTVTPGHVWLEGDNAEISMDSRNYGEVPISLLRGRAFCRIYPFSSARLFARNDIEHHVCY